MFRMQGGQTVRDVRTGLGSKSRDVYINTTHGYAVLHIGSVNSLVHSICTYFTYSARFVVRTWLWYERTNASLNTREPAPASLRFTLTQTQRFVV